MPADVTWTEPRGGFSLLLTLPAALSAAALLPRAAERGVAFTPGSPFFLDERGDSTLRLSFSSLPAAHIDEGVRRLADTIKDALRRPVERRTPERSLVPLV
jgi:2-aminoadipate transaminase